jgi:hypothetical protein
MVGPEGRFVSLHFFLTKFAGPISPDFNLVGS